MASDVTSESVLYAQLASWNLPESIVDQYTKIGVSSMFEWQVSCLQTGNALNGGNLLFSAPTSAGKTLVAEILILKRVLQTRRKAIFILPFVSVAREKAYALRRLFSVVGIRVGAFVGSHTPPGGLDYVDIAVCTIERANGLINRLLEAGGLRKLCSIVVDELHMVGDDGRGYLLEPLLTKVNYFSSRNNLQDMDSIQIIGMSATLPNLSTIAKWLHADLYTTDFRPIPLTEFIKIDERIYDNKIAYIRDVQIPTKFDNDDEQITNLCLETIKDKKSVLIFCPTKAWCETLSYSIAKAFYNIFCDTNPNDDISLKSYLEEALNKPRILSLLDQLKQSPAGVNPRLQLLLSYMCAYHHAGLTSEERDIVETGFKESSIRVLVSTTTLSAGVNLPAQRVIIRSPFMYGGKLIETHTYKQMCGRAGRKGIDTSGESILICKPSEKKKVLTLLNSDLSPARSRLMSEDSEGNILVNSSVKRALLEIIAGKSAQTLSDLQTYIDCTLMAAEIRERDGASTKQLVEQCVTSLESQEFILCIKSESGESTRVAATQLGQAVFASSMNPDDSLTILSELNQARKCFVLENELHMIYQVTPLHVYIGKLDWMRYMSIWESLSSDKQRVGELVGVTERFIMSAQHGKRRRCAEEQRRLERIHARFYAALILDQLCNETSLLKVEEKFGVNRGTLQSLQQQAATFAGMVSTFCDKLGWTPLRLLLHDIQPRLDVGVRHELVDLIRVESVDGRTARHLFDAGIHTVEDLSEKSTDDIMDVIINMVPFESGKQEQGESEWDLKERSQRRIFISGQKSLTVLEAARAILRDAQLVQNGGKIPQSPQKSTTSVPIEPKQRESLQTVFKEPSVPEPVLKHSQEDLLSDTKQTVLMQAVAQHPSNNKFIKHDLDSRSSEPSHSLSTVNTPAKGKVDKGSDDPPESPDNDPIISDTVTITKDSSESQPLMSQSTLNSQALNSMPLETPTSLTQTDSQQEEIWSHNASLSASFWDDMSWLSQVPHEDSPEEKGSLPETTNTKTSLKGGSPLQPSRKRLSTSLHREQRSPRSPLSPAFTRIKRARMSAGKRAVKPSNIATTPKAKGPSGTDELSVAWSSFNESEIIDSPTDKVKEKIRLQSLASSSPADILAARTPKRTHTRQTAGGNHGGTTPGNPDVTSQSDELFTNSMDSLLISPMVGSPIHYVNSQGSHNAHSPGPVKQSASTPYTISLVDKPQVTRDAILPAPEPQLLSSQPSNTSLHIEDMLAGDLITFQVLLSKIQTCSSIGLSLACQRSRSEKDDPTEGNKIGAAAVGPKLEKDLSTLVTVVSDGIALDQFSTVIVGVAFSLNELSSEVLYLSFNQSAGLVPIEERIAALASILANNSSVKVIFDSKEVVKRIVRLIGPDSPIRRVHDPKIALWMLEPADREASLEAAIKLTIPELRSLYKDLSPREKCRGSLGLHPAYSRASGRLRSVYEAHIALRIMIVLKGTLKEKQLWRSFNEVEMDHLLTLTEMETTGFGFSPTIWQQQHDLVTSRLSYLEEKAYRLVGRPFRISSPIETGQILYIELKLPFENRTLPRGRSRRQAAWSTSKETLEKITHLHPLPGVILEWRKLTSCVNSLLIPVNQNKVWCQTTNMYRLFPHCCVFTATGRVTMWDPNLQSIPRPHQIAASESQETEEIEVKMREVFVPRKGCTLLSFDYCQLELRVISHLAGERKLASALNSGADPFIDIAAQWLDIARDSVTDQQRQQAKGMCYGVIYGMGSTTLAQQLHTNVESARRFMSEFRCAYPELQNYVEKVVKQCSENGYVRTIAGRIRYLEHIRTSSNSAVHAHAERQAVNTSVQGSAADIVKFATVQISRNLKTDAKLVLQIHDELLYEVPDNQLQDSATQISDIMQSVSKEFKLSVKLTVRAKAGPSWGALTEMKSDLL